MGISFAFQQPVRFKGIRVIDLLSRIGAEEVLSGAEPNYDAINTALGNEIRKSKDVLIQMLTDVKAR